MIQNPTQQSVLNRTSKDKFVLVLNLPLVLRKLATTDSNISIDPLQISVYGTIVPQIQIPANEVRFSGQAVNVSSHSRPNYSPLTISFLIDNRFYNYWILWKWLNILNSARESIYEGFDERLFSNAERLEQGNLLQYQANFSIHSLNEYNEKTVEFIYYNAFPTTLGGIEYNYQDGAIITSTVDFQFNQLDVKLLKK